MQLTQQELIKAILNGVGVLIDARAKTTEVNLKAYIDDRIHEVKVELGEVKQELRSEMYDFRDELKTEVQVLKEELSKTKKELQQEIKATRLELKSDIHTLRVDLGTKVTNHEDRITTLEQKKLSHRN